jgi:hypothetical protein
MTSRTESLRGGSPETHIAPRDRVTRLLLGCGVLAEPVYVVVSLAQALTRDGFDLTRHEWSLLANGPHGWIQVVNLIASGAMVITGAIGLRRFLSDRAAPGRAATALAVYGLGLLAAGVFRADPSDGYPPGTPAGTNHEVSWHGALHLATASIGFLGLIVACLMMGGWFRRTAMAGWARYSRVTGVLFLAAFVGIAVGAGHVAANLAFTAAVLLASAWVSAVFVWTYRSLRTDSQ